MRLAILLLASWPCWGAIGSAPVQTECTGSISSGTTGSCVFGGNTTSGNNVYLLSSVGASTTVHVSAVSGLGCTWSETGHSNTQSYEQIWQGLNCTSPGTTISITISSASTTRFIGAEWAGTSTAGTTDGTAANNQTSSQIITGSITPTASENLLILAVGQHSGSFTSGPTSSFVAFATPNAGFRGAYLVVASTTGSYSTTWTYGSSSASEAYIAGFRAPAAGSSTAIPVVQ